MLLDPFYVPGMGDPITSTENAFVFGRQEGWQYEGGTIVSTAVDANNSPTTTLRAGLVMGKVTSTGKWIQYSPTATNGSQFARGVLMHGRNMLDPRTATAGDRQAMILVGGAGLKAGSLYGLDEQARKHLSGAGFFFDDQRSLAVMEPRLVTAKTADYTVVAADNGTLFTTVGAAGAVNFALPAIAAVAPGWSATFFNEVDQNNTVTAPRGLLVGFNNAARTSIAFSTASEKIGCGVRIVVNPAGTKYLAFPILGAETATPTYA